MRGQEMVTREDTVTSLAGSSYAVFRWDSVLGSRTLTSLLSSSSDDSDCETVLPRDPQL